MFGRLLPYTTDFFKYFESHIDVCLKGAENLKKMMEQTPFHQVDSAKEIILIEKAGDEIARQCIADLYKTFITPFERNDIYRLITSMDDILDAMEDISACIVTYKLETHLKKTKIPDFILKAIKELKKVISGLRDQKSLELMKPILINIHKFENEVDDLTRKNIGLLFENEKDPILLIKWKDIYEKLEEATDNCQTVANILEGLIMENS